MIAHLSKTHEDEVGVAYFYCDFSQSESCVEKNIVGSLVSQLCSQLGYPEELRNAYKSSLVSGQKRKPDWDILEQALRWFTTQRKILILIDALDECGQRDNILKLLTKLHKSNEQVGILVTSREEHDIKDALPTASRITLESHNLEMKRDISIYIDYRLEHDKVLKDLPSTVKHNIRTSLNRRCAGMYVYYSLRDGDLLRAL